RLEERMRALGVRTIGDYVLAACGNARAAVARAVADEGLRARLERSLAAGGVGALAPLAGDAYEPIVREAALLNTPALVAKATADPRYKAEKNRALPRKIGSKLWLFDCINCDKC